MKRTLIDDSLVEPFKLTHKTIEKGKWLGRGRNPSGASGAVVFNELNPCNFEDSARIFAEQVAGAVATQEYVVRQEPLDFSPAAGSSFLT